MSEGLGTQWSEPVRRAGEVWSPDGGKSRSMLVTYSIGGDHQIELVQLLDDTAWAWARAARGCITWATCASAGLVAAPSEEQYPTD